MKAYSNAHRASLLREAINASEATAKRLLLADFIAGDDVLEKFKAFDFALRTDFRATVALAEAEAAAKSTS